jgi:hypothetical protein
VPAIEWLERVEKSANVIINDVVAFHSMYYLPQQMKSHVLASRFLTLSLKTQLSLFENIPSYENVRHWSAKQVEQFRKGILNRLS